jgi:hypothetical protein
MGGYGCGMTIWEGTGVVWEGTGVVQEGVGVVQEGVGVVQVRVQEGKGEGRHSLSMSYPLIIL